MINLLVASHRILLLWDLRAAIELEKVQLVFYAAVVIDLLLQEVHSIFDEHLGLARLCWIVGCTLFLSMRSKFFLRKQGPLSRRAFLRAVFYVLTRLLYCF